MAKFFPRETITRVRGKARKVNGLTVYPMMHPAAALHRQELRKVIEDDFKAIPSVLKEVVDSEDEAQDNTLPESEAPPQQLSMF